MREIRIDEATLEYDIEIGNGDAAVAKRHVVIVGAKDVQGHIVIPARIEGLPVKRIGGLAFAGCNGLTGVTMQDGVTWISESAFAYAKNLTYVKIPASVRGIDHCAFAGCGGLWRVDIPEGVMWVGISAFIMCCSLVDVKIPSTLEHVPQYAFSDCCRLSAVTISNGVASIGDGTFSDCISLLKITLPDSVNSIGCTAFRGCCSLKNVSLSCELESRMPKLAFGSSSSELTLSYRGKRDACEINQSNCLLSDFTDGVVY